MIRDGQPAYKVVAENGVEKVVYVEKFNTWVEMYTMPFKGPITLGVFATKEEAEANCGTMLAQMREVFNEVFKPTGMEQKREVKASPLLGATYKKERNAVDEYHRERIRRARRLSTKKSDSRS